MQNVRLLHVIVTVEKDANSADEQMSDHRECGTTFISLMGAL